jgi:hypothetical protein
MIIITVLCALLRRIFRLKRDKMVLDRRKLHNYELRNFNPSSDIIRMMKSRRMTWAGHVERVREKRNPYRILVGKPEGKNSLRRPRRVMIILKLILEKWDGLVWSGFTWFRIRTS